MRPGSSKGKLEYTSRAFTGRRRILTCDLAFSAHVLAGHRRLLAHESVASITLGCDQDRIRARRQGLKDKTAVRQQPAMCYAEDHCRRTLAAKRIEQRSRELELAASEHWARLQILGSSEEVAVVQAKGGWRSHRGCDSVLTSVAARAHAPWRPLRGRVPRRLALRPVGVGRNHYQGCCQPCHTCQPFPA